MWSAIFGERAGRSRAMPSWSLAIEGARREVGALKGALPKARRIAWFGYFTVREFLSTAMLVPFALRSATARTRVTSETVGRLLGSRARVQRRRYGDLERNMVDVYTPKPTELHDRLGSKGQGLPVVLFVHGGVWSSGELWHYSAMGEDLASQGCVVVVATYNFYPQVSVEHQVKDVKDAIDWTERNCESFGGNREDVTLVGHSSGAHLSLMAVLEGATSRQCPRSVVLMAGVYDIAKHYEYERRRGVHSMSAMERAHGGEENFARFSPALLLGGESVLGPGTSSDIEDRERQRAELMAEEPEGVCERMRSAGLVLEGGDSGPGRAAGAKKNNERFGSLPEIHLMSGLRDNVVPWYWSQELALVLRENECSFRNTVYSEADHLSFIGCFNRGEGENAIREDLIEIFLKKRRASQRVR